MDANKVRLARHCEHAVADVFAELNFHRLIAFCVDFAVDVYALANLFGVLDLLLDEILCELRIRLRVGFKHAQNLAFHLLVLP